MKQFIKRIWGKCRLTAIIILSIAIGSIYALVITDGLRQYKETKALYDWTWNETIHLQQMRIDGGPVSEKVQSQDKSVSLNLESEQVAVADSLVNPSSVKAGRVKPPAGAEGIIETIYEIAKQEKFNQPELLVKIAKAESGLRPCAKNPNSSATGLFQILDLHKLTKEDRCNPEIATRWAIKNFNEGKPWASSKSKWANI